MIGEEVNMHRKRGQIILSLLAIILGAVLILAGQGHSAVWPAGGGFFIAIGAGSLLMTLGSVLQGMPGEVLRHPIFNAVILVAVAATFLVMIYFAFVP